MAEEIMALTAADFDMPPAPLAGTVDYDMYKRFREQLGAAPAAGLVVIELSTLGGDPEVARMMGEDIRFHSAGDLSATTSRSNLARPPPPARKGDALRR